MGIYQITVPATGTQIMWVSGNASNEIGTLTIAQIDNEIAYNLANNMPSIESETRDLFNTWLMNCNITDDITGAAFSVQQQGIIRRAFLLFCLYRYAKDNYNTNLASGNCDCDCEAKMAKLKQYLKTLSNGVICQSIAAFSHCVRDLYLQWLNNSCTDSFGGMFGSFVATEIPCYKPNYRERSTCDSCGS